jgi:hypothetical protein
MSRSALVATVAAVVVAASLGAGLWARANETVGEQDHPTVPQLIKALEPELGDAQDALLADGVLTREEFESAQDRVAACLETRGIRPIRQPGGVGGATTVIGEAPAGTPPDEGAKTFMACQEEHVGKLGIIWAEQHRPSAAEQADKERAERECLVANGGADLVGHQIGNTTIFPPGSLGHWLFLKCHMGFEASLPALIPKERGGQGP